MFGITGALSSIDYRNMGQKFIFANNIVITSISPISSSSWVKKTSVEGLIKSRIHNSSIVNTVNTNTSSSITSSMSIAGSHVATVGAPYASSQVSPTYQYPTTIASTSGSHYHSFTISLNAATLYPDSLYVGIYESNLGTIFTLPVGALIFAENIASNDLYGISAISTYDNFYLRATSNDGLMGTTYSSTTSSIISYTTTTSGAHDHNPATGSFGLSSPTNGTEYSLPYDNSTTGYEPSHSHTGSVTVTQTKKYKKLRTYVVTQSGASISNGMIFAFNNTSINLAPNWYCCNGQIIGGYTTPNLVDRYIMCGNSIISSHNINGSGSSDTNNAYCTSTTSSTNNWTHDHGSVYNYQVLTGYATAQRYHTAASVPHSHTQSTSTTGFEPYHRNYIYCIYLP
jgi:hypothetical protein